MEGENKITAKFLQARITTLSTTLIKRLENIFAAALTSDPPTAADSTIPPSYVETATEQFNLDVESTALVRAAEEIMVLTRGMKDLWLFGGLDTLKGEDEKDDGRGEGDGGTRKTIMDDDVRVVGEALKRYLGQPHKEGNEMSFESTEKPNA